MNKIMEAGYGKAYAKKTAAAGVVKEAAEKILKKETLVIGPGVKNGLNILMDNPAQLGSDLVANAVLDTKEWGIQAAHHMIDELKERGVIGEEVSYK